MLTLQDMRNIKAFLERVPLTGKEAIAWCQTAANLDVAIEVQTRAETTQHELKAALPEMPS